MTSKKDDYLVLGTIGEGSFGVCQKVMRKSDKKILVWKQVEFGGMSEVEKEALVSEVNLLRELRHTNIVRYYDRIIDREHTTLYIVMEFCEGGDLASLIKKSKKTRQLIDENQIWRWFSQMLAAMQECHRRKEGIVLHRDIKPANIFLDAGSNVKLGDFGLARVLSHSAKFARTCVGTPYYMSPELVNEQLYNEKSDIWSLGCLLYELCALAPPFEAPTQVKLDEKIRKGKFNPIPSHYSAELSEVIRTMLQLDPKLRPSIEDLMTTSSRVTSRTQETKLAALVKKCTCPDSKAREDTLASREEALRLREEKLRAREAALDERERLLNLREALAQPPREALKPRRPSVVDENIRPLPPVRGAVAKPFIGIIEP